MCKQRARRHQHPPIWLRHQHQPGSRVVQAQLPAPGPPGGWADVVPQHPKDLLQSAVALAGDNLVLRYLRDVRGALALHRCGPRACVRLCVCVVRVIGFASCVCVCVCVCVCECLCVCVCMWLCTLPWALTVHTHTHKNSHTHTRTG